MASNVSAKIELIEQKTKDGKLVWVFLDIFHYNTRILSIDLCSYEFIV